MFFPIKYTGDILISKPDNYIREVYTSEINKHLKKHINPINQAHELVSPLPWVNLSLRYKFSIAEDYDTLQINYSISLFELNIFFVLSFGLSVFFSLSQNMPIAFLFAFAAFGYYWFALSKVNSNIKSMLINKQQSNHPLEEPGLWKRQQKWMKDDQLCPACGNEQNPYSTRCTTCGLISDLKKRNQFNNSSFSQDLEEIHYHLKKDDNA